MAKIRDLVDPNTLTELYRLKRRLEGFPSKKRPAKKGRSAPAK